MLSANTSSFIVGVVHSTFGETGKQKNESLKIRVTRESNYRDLAVDTKQTTERQQPQNENTTTNTTTNDSYGWTCRHHYQTIVNSSPHLIHSLFNSSCRRQPLSYNEKICQILFVATVSDDLFEVYRIFSVVCRNKIIASSFWFLFVCQKEEKGSQEKYFKGPR